MCLRKNVCKWTDVIHGALSPRDGLLIETIKVKANNGCCCRTSLPLLAHRVLLLVVAGTWTALGIRLLVVAQSLEYAVEKNVHRFAMQLVSQSWMVPFAGL